MEGQMNSSEREFQRLRIALDKVWISPVFDAEESDRLMQEMWVLLDTLTLQQHPILNGKHASKLKEDGYITISLTGD
jgi:hypothetical protein